MPLYEIMTIATVAAPASHLVSLFKRCASAIHRGSGVFRRIDNLGLRPLAYRMRAHHKFNYMGRYLRLSIQASPQLLRDIEKRLRADEEIIRYLSIKQDEIAPTKEYQSLAIPSYAQPVFDLTGHNERGTDKADMDFFQRNTDLDYYAARTLLEYGVVQPEEIAILPRHRPDPIWEEKVKDLKHEQEEQERRVKERAEALERERQEELDARAEEERKQVALYDEERERIKAREKKERDEWSANEKVLSQARLVQLSEIWLEERLSKNVKKWVKAKKRAGMTVSDQELAKFKEKQMKEILTIRKKKAGVRAEERPKELLKEIDAKLERMRLEKVQYAEAVQRQNDILAKARLEKKLMKETKQ